MELTHVILGAIVTEKAERLKAEEKTYTINIAPKATKIDVIAALKTFYDVDTESVRIIRTRPKTRQIGRNRTMQKRARSKKALVTLAKGSKSLDLTTFKK